MRAKVAGMSRSEMLGALRAERLSATQKLMILKQEIKQRQNEIDTLETRLRDIDHAEGLLS